MFLILLDTATLEEGMLKAWVIHMKSYSHQNMCMTLWIMIGTIHVLFSVDLMLQLLHNLPCLMIRQLWQLLDPMELSLHGMHTPSYHLLLRHLTILVVLVVVVDKVVVFFIERILLKAHLSRSRQEWGIQKLHF